MIELASSRILELRSGRFWKVSRQFAISLGSTKVGLALAKERVPSRNEREGRSSVCRKRVNEEAAVGCDGVLPVCDALGGDACLKEDAWWACRPCVRIKTDRDQLSIRLNEEYLPAVMAPAGLRARSRRNLHAPAVSREAFDENPPPYSHVNDPSSIRRKLGFYAINRE